MKKLIECKTGETFTSYGLYLQSNHWAQTKKRFYNTKKNKFCRICKIRKNLNVHHKTYANIGKEFMKDLVTLCESCHEDVHYEIEQDNSYFTIYQNDVIIKRLIKQKLALKRTRRTRT